MARYYSSNYYAYETETNIFFKIKKLIHSIKLSLPKNMSKGMLLNDLYVFATDGESRVLDIGCGDGHALLELKDLGFEELYGSEIDEKSKPRLEAKGIKALVTNDITKEKLPSDFDLVRLSHVLEHLYNPYETLQYSNALLRNGGRIVIGVPNFDSPARKLFKEYFCGLQLPTHLYHFTPTTLSKMLEINGFKIEKLKTTGFSGFSYSIVIFLRQKLSIKLPSIIETIFVVALSPMDIILNVFGKGYILVVEAKKE